MVYISSIDLNCRVRFIFRVLFVIRNKMNVFYTKRRTIFKFICKNLLQGKYYLNEPTCD